LAVTAATPRPFDVPGFRWLWLSTMLTWMAWAIMSLTLGWLMLQLTNSPFWVGLGVGVRGAAQALCSLPGGALADRVDRRRLLLVTQVTMAAISFGLAAIVLAGAARVGHVLAFMAFVGVLAAADRPATSGLFYDLVGPARILSAGALKFVGQAATNIMASLAGGAVLEWLGMGQNLVLMGSLHAMAAAALLILPKPAAVTNLVGPLARSIAEGIDYARRTPPVRALLNLSLITECFGFASLTMMPVIARDVLRVGGLGLGYLTAMGGVGQLLATLALVVRGDVRDKPRLLMTSAVAFGVLIAVLGLSRWQLLSMLVATLVYACGVTYDVTMFAALPVLSTDAMRGRVLGLFAATIAFSQLGGLVVGAGAAVIGAPLALVASGLLAAGGALRFGGGLRGAVAFAEAGEPAGAAGVPDRTSPGQEPRTHA
jgi:MFS family permease